MNESMRSVTIARQIDRPSTKQFIEEIFDDFMEFHGDRLFGDDGAVIGGIASLKGQPVTVIGIQKGHTLEENVNCNFGQPNPEGYRKALRLMKQAEKFHRPIILFVDTPGAFCGLEAEEGGVGEAIARNLFEMSNIKVPILSIMIGEGGSGGALALAVCDELAMLEHALYSVISPRGFASILWKDPSREKEAADLMKITADDLYNFGVCDKIISESVGGAHTDPAQTADNISEYLISAVERLSMIDIPTLLDNRYKKFRKIGMFSE